MTSDARDPREAVLANILHLDRGEVERVGVEVLARLDAADPLRAALEDVVEGLRRIYRLTEPEVTEQEDVDLAWLVAHDLLARLSAFDINPEEAA